VGNGMVYLSSKDFTVYALDEGTGSMLWRISNVAAVVSSPVLADGKLFYGTLYSSSAGRAEFLALNPQDGTVFWRQTISDYIEGSAAVSKGLVFFGIGAISNAVVVALNATTGGLIWSYTTPTGGAVASSPAIALGSKTVFFGSNDRYLYAVNMMTGTFLWRYLTGGQVSSSPAVADTRVFIGAKDAKVYA